MKKITLNVKDMQCSGCETIIETALTPLAGIVEVDADYPSGTVKIHFDETKTRLDEIKQTIEAAGYTLAEIQPQKKSRGLKLVLTLLAVLILVVIMVGARKISHHFSLPDLNSPLSDSMIFLVGLITGLHCIGMCGGFVISYTAKTVEQHRPLWFAHFLYGFGKTLSYAMFGALFGLLGSLISITPFIQGVTNLAAGAFLIIFGLNMLGLFAILKHIRFKQPKRIAHFVVNRNKQSRSPFLIGFFTGFLLGCGPLQAMYVMAAGSSDPVTGAKILTLFGLGTLPALLSFGYITRWISATATKRFFQLSGVILIIVGGMMLNKGLIRTHSGYDFKSIEHKIIHYLQQ
jgi:sulfite exporter TauE/SafE/copper chaperone CopZ